PTPLITTLEASGTPYELLDPPELEHRFGLVTQCCKAVFQPEAGVVRADGGLAAFRAGIDVREETHVRTIAPDGDGVRIETDVVAFGANLVVVAAGAWARPQLAAADIDLAVAPTRETVAYFDFGGQRSVPS